MATEVALPAPSAKALDLVLWVPAGGVVREALNEVPRSLRAAGRFLLAAGASTFVGMPKRKRSSSSGSEDESEDESEDISSGDEEEEDVELDDRQEQFEQEVEGQDDAEEDAAAADDEAASGDEDEAPPLVSEQRARNAYRNDVDGAELSVWLGMLERAGLPYIDYPE